MSQIHLFSTTSMTTTLVQITTIIQLDNSNSSPTAPPRCTLAALHCPPKGSQGVLSKCRRGYDTPMCGDFWCFPPLSSCEPLHSLACSRLHLISPRSRCVPEFQPCHAICSVWNAPYSLPAQGLTCAPPSGYNVLLRLAVGPPAILVIRNPENQKLTQSSFKKLLIKV